MRLKRTCRSVCPALVVCCLTRGQWRRCSFLPLRVSRREQADRRSFSNFVSTPYLPVRAFACLPDCPRCCDCRLFRCVSISSILSFRRFARLPAASFARLPTLLRLSACFVFNPMQAGLAHRISFFHPLCWLRCAPFSACGTHRPQLGRLHRSRHR
jgi:hypothetical protein